MCSRYSLAHLHGSLHSSAADVVRTRAKQWGVLYTNDEVCALSFFICGQQLSKKQCCYCRLDIFDYRLYYFSIEFLKSSAKPLVEIVDYGIRTKFQA